MRLPPPRLRRVAWIALRAVVATYVLYLVTLNGLFVTGLAKTILNALDPAHVSIDYESAYSVWFARVHTRGFVIRGEDTAVVWSITTEQASTTFVIGDFFERKVHMFDTAAKGVRVKIAFKPAPAIPLPPLTDASYNLWAAQLDDIVADDLLEVRVDGLHFLDGRGGYLKGGFILKPMRLVRVDPAEWHVSNGQLLIDERSVATEIHGSFEVGVHELDPRTPSGMDALAYVDAHVVTTATLTDLAWIDALVGPSVAVLGGGGPLVIAARARKGVLESGSRLDLESRSWAAWSGDTWLAGSSVLRARVPVGTEGAVVLIDSSTVGVHHGTASIASAPSFGVAARWESADLAAASHPWKAHLDLPASSVADLRSVDALLGGDAFLYGGSGRMSGELDADPTGASGDANIVLSRATARAMRTMVTADATLSLVLRRYDAGSKRADFSRAVFALRDVSAGEEKGYWLDASAAPFTLSLARAPELHAGLVGKVRDARLPLVVLGAPSLVTKLAGRQSFTLKADLTLTPAVVTISGLRLVGDSLDVRGHCRIGGVDRDKNGAALLSTSLLDVGVRMSGGELSIDPLASRRWYDATL